MDAYSTGMSAELAKFAVTKYKSHRMISGTLDKEIEEAIARQFAKELQRDREREDGGGRSRRRSSRMKGPDWMKKMQRWSGRYIGGQVTRTGRTRNWMRRP